MTPNGPMARCRVLVIHADVLMARTLANTFEHHGAIIAGAHHEVSAALEAVAASTPGRLVAVLDGDLPGAGEIATALAGARISYLVMAGKDRTAATHACATATIPVPVMQADLLPSVFALCRGVSSR